MDTFWRTQEKSKPLFPDIEWNKPERADQAGRLGIIGGSQLGFAVMAESFRAAKEAGAGEVRLLLPDALKKTIPPSITDALFAPTNPSGGFAIDAAPDMAALCDWADVVLLPGDAGKNSQTASLYENLATSAMQPLVLTRDAVDLVLAGAPQWLDNPRVVVVLSLAQLQKICRAIYYPKILTFSMQLAQLVETVHKFTITYPVTLMTFHADHLIIAHDGQVITQRWDQPMSLWRGTTAARAAAYLLWTPHTPLQALAASVS